MAATRRSNKFPRVNWRILSKILSPQQNFVAATCRAATKFCHGDKIAIILHTFRSKCMEYKWYDVSQRVNEPHYATHGRLETIRKRGNSPCCEPHMLEPPA